MEGRRREETINQYLTQDEAHPHESMKGLGERLSSVRSQHEQHQGVAGRVQAADEYSSQQHS